MAWKVASLGNAGAGVCRNPGPADVTHNPVSGQHVIAEAFCGCEFRGAEIGVVIRKHPASRSPLLYCC